MNRLEAKRNFELAAQPVAKLEATIPNQSRVALDNDTVKLGQALGDRGIFSLGDGFDIEETACVVEFDLAQLGQAAALAFCLANREVDLPGDGTGRHGFVEGVLPEIAHQAAPRAFLVGEKDRQPINETAVVIAFLLEQPGVGAAWVKRALLATLPGDPVAAGGRGFRISKAGICGRVRNKARGIFYGVAPHGRGCFRGANQPMLRRAGSGVFQKPACQNQAQT